jgi:4-hydroxy-3-methylbut-2-enyl diphosphate reductase
LGILSQTTQNSEGFAQFVSRAVELILTSIGEMRVVNTICSATAKRQAAAVALVKKVDLMLVVGGYNSANTRHLAETCSNLGVETHHIEAASELDKSWFRGKLRIGITAGASTPDGAVNEVVLRLSELT